MKSAQLERKPLEDPILHYAARMEVFFMKTALLQKSLSVRHDNVWTTKEMEKFS